MKEDQLGERQDVFAADIDMKFGGGLGLLAVKGFGDCGDRLWEATEMEIGKEFDLMVIRKPTSDWVRR